MRYRGGGIVHRKNFKLNKKWQENAQIYQTKRIEACQYIKGMETGYMVHYFNKLNSHNQGVKCFDTEDEAWNFIRKAESEYILLNDKKVEIKTIGYHPPAPILHYPLSDSENRKGTNFDIEEEQAFLSNESRSYDILELKEDIWIIRDDEGKIYTWQSGIDDSSIFGECSDFLTKISKVGRKRSNIRENYQLYATDCKRKLFLVADFYNFDIAKQIINTADASYDLELFMNDNLVYSIVRGY